MFLVAKISSSISDKSFHKPNLLRNSGGDKTPARPPVRGRRVKIDDETKFVISPLTSYFCYFVISKISLAKLICVEKLTMSKFTVKKFLCWQFPGGTEKQKQHS